MPKAARKKNSRQIAYILLLITTVFWGASFPIVKPALDIITANRFLFYRFLLASLASIPLLIYYIPRMKNLWAKTWKVVLIESLTVVSLGILYEGLRRTTVLEASLLGTTAPLFIVLAGVLLLKEKEEKHEWIGSLIAMIGASLIVLLPAFRGEALLSSFSFSGNLLVIVQNIILAFYFFLAKKYFKGIPIFFIVSVSFVMCAVTFFFLSLAETQTLGNLSHFFDIMKNDLQHLSVWIACGYMAIFASIIGLACYLKGQEKIEISEASVFWYLQPLIYIPLSMWLLNEKITLLHLISLGLILGGVIIAERRFSSYNNAS